METSKLNTTFQQYLQSAFHKGIWSTDEIIEFILPLFEEVLSFHENGQVGSFEKPETIFLTDGRLDIDENFTHSPVIKLQPIEALIESGRVNGYTITGRILIEQDLSESYTESSNLEVAINPNSVFTHPVFFQGYECYEMKLGHHDSQTDIFCLGLILGSVTMGLNLYNITDLNKFANYRQQPAGLNNRVHPTLCGLITEMTELNRADRSRDLKEIILRIKYYRDYDPQKQTDLASLAIFQSKKPSDRKSFILSKLRSRLFDTSRRNRLLYYKPNGRFVNLTVSSVPMVLHYQSINPQLLFTWNEEISEQIISQKDIVLNKYLRFEDHPYLNAQLNGIRQQAESDRKEYGFSQLKLVIAFLHWHNLKGESSERIQTPLLLLPVRLERKRALKEEKFTLEIIDQTALVNPILANHLKDLYGIELPESIALDKVSMEEFFQVLESKITACKQGVKLNYIDKPRIKIVHNVACQTINAYRKRLKLKATTGFQQLEYSYSEENYKPLGLELFRQKVQLKQSAIEFLLDPRPPFNTANFAATKDVETKSTFHLADGESNAYSWDFDICNIVLGNFNYKKMSLVSDYNKVEETQITHQVFDELFSNEAKKEHTLVSENNPSEWYHVITADPTQSKAVLHSRTGESYIIQGPPGTGKSQTITNLIADFLANKKTVLFVCEKRAALDVVYYRLQQNNLAELCCYIHDSQDDKKEFYKDLKNIYEDFLNKKMDVNGIVAQRNFVMKQFLKEIELLQLYHAQQCEIDPTAGIPTRQLIEKLVSIKDHFPQLEEKEKEKIPSYKDWIKFGNVIDQLGKSLENIGVEPKMANHPFSNLGIQLINSENPFSLMDSLIGNSFSSIQSLSELVSQNKIPIEFAFELKGLKNLIEDALLLESLAKSKNLQLVDLANPDAKDFDEAYHQYKELLNSYQKAADLNKRWVTKFDQQEVVHAIKLAEKFEKSFFGFLNSKWRQVKKQLNKSYDFSSHQIKPPFSLVLKQLELEYAAGEIVSSNKQLIEKKFNVGDIETIYSGLTMLRNKQGDKEVDFLLQHPRANELVLQLSKLNNTLQQLELQLSQALYGYQNKPINEIKDELATIAANAGSLRELLPALRRFTELPENIQEFIRKLPITPIQAEAAMAKKTMQLLMSQKLTFAGINQKVIQESVRNIDKYYKQLLKINSDFIRSNSRQQFLSNYEISIASTANLTSEQKILKKIYMDGRRILEHEMNKSKQYKSIREIASNDSGIVLKDIKPVWLMSPLSVSDSLPIDQGFFDVVIFDEASQITLEEGIPALFRAPQAIIVGDDKQMPPSNFFSAKAEDPEDLEMIDGETEDEILSSDADSLLVQGSRKLNSTMLSWHYRSRYESLISYSNHAFYEAGLLTIPDRTIHQISKSLIEPLAPEEGTANAMALLGGSISFHYLANSIYENRGNISEAKYISYMIRELLLRETSDTIGIVAFSQEQQSVIEEAITLLAQTDKNFEELLEKAYNRKDDGQFTGLFIKNLENVQGDERDIIIMSVCYGHDCNRKLLMNFGPINRKGGEKRLNVIFSRARKHMAVISSIRHYHITNDYNEGANYFKKFLHYAEMVHVGNMASARNILDTLIQKKGFEIGAVSKQNIVANQIKQSLEAKGYLVDERIGQSVFKCNIGIKRTSDDTFYALGILIDDEDHYQNEDLVEQYFQRPSILQSFGWKVINVFAKDWMDDNGRVIQTIINELENRPDDIPFENFTPEVVTKSSNRWELATEHRFWIIDGYSNQLTINFGRIGMTGQSIVKSFNSIDEMELERKRLIEEQERNGYINVSVGLN